MTEHHNETTAAESAVVECVRCGTEWTGELPVACPGCHSSAVR